MRWAPPLLAPGVLLVAAGALFGWTFVPALSDPPEPDMTFASVCAFIDIALTIAILLGVSWWFRRASGSPRGLGGATAIAIALLAIAVGAGAFAPPPTWLRPPALTGISGTFAAAGLLFFALSLIARSRRVREVSAESRILASAPVLAVVTDQGYEDEQDWTGTDGSSRTLVTRVTYRFTDHVGRQRWVTRVTGLDRKNPVVNGEEHDLWYDRDHPGKTDRIIIRRR